MASKLQKLGLLYRSHYLKNLTRKNLNQEVKIAGFISRVRENSFFDVKDTESGQDYTLQILVNDTVKNFQKSQDNNGNNGNDSLTNPITVDSNISIKGKLIDRPLKDQKFTSKVSGKNVNKLQRFELAPTEILSLSSTDKAIHRNKLNSNDWENSANSYKLENRFLSLRTDENQQTLKFRSRVLQKFRSILHDKYDFTEIETPTLFSPSPGGAREFIVPSSYYPNQFYSLVQSPQQFKQILMIGGFERYFQIAKCYRDEKLNNDRQPEFTQLDLEMAYVTREEIMGLIEDILEFSLSREFDGFKGPFKVFTFDECIERFGSDKPDIRFGFEIEKGDKSSGSSSPSSFIDVSNLSISNKKLKTLISICEKEHPKNTKAALKNGKIHSNDVLLLGRIRNAFKPFLSLEQFDNCSFKPLWVIDFPLFEKKEIDDIHRAAADILAESEFQTVHHPFTSPLDTTLEASSYNLSTKSAAYDLVLNGHEIGGGSIRIHNPNLQREIFKILDINKNGELEHVLKALSAGAPPHGGIALGLDRLMAVLLQKKTLEDVIAFPKSAGGRCYLSGAPVKVRSQVKETYHLKSMDEESVHRINESE